MHTVKHTIDHSTRDEIRAQRGAAAAHAWRQVEHKSNLKKDDVSAR